MNGIPGSVEIDPVSAMTAIMTIFLGPIAASYVGPYFVIFVAGFFGSLIALRRQEATMGAMKMLLFIFIVVFLAALVTVPIAHAISVYYGAEWFRWALAPIALGIGMIGYDWDKVGLFVWEQRLLLFDAMDKLRSIGKPSAPPPGKE